MKQQLQTADLVGGVPPERARAEFVAPLIGPGLGGVLRGRVSVQAHGWTRLAKKDNTFHGQKNPRKRDGGGKSGAPAPKKARKQAI